MPMQKLNQITFESPPFDGVCMDATMFDLILGQAPMESVWIPMQFARVLSFDLTGGLATVSVQLLGSNSKDDPGNLSTITVGGTITAADVNSITVKNPNLPDGQKVVSYTSVGGNTTTIIATQLAAAINADADLKALQISASSLAAVITISYPSSSPTAGGQEGSSVSDPPVSNTCLFSGASTGAATETFTVANASNGSTIGAAITAKGLTAITTLPRWIKAQVNTLTGAGAAIAGNLHGAT